ncbi:MAG: hypothetical protein R3176_04660 [Woeseiaceae bacterium]|nr:hypothetical protein [Woeseiaceae bacterium]
MKLKQYALVAEVVGGLAVVVGLVFVGLELRQNTLMQRVTATQALSVNYENAVDALGKDTETACIYVRGIKDLENLNGIERYRFFVLWFHVLRAGEQLHYYSLEGMVDERIWRGYERQLRVIFGYPGVQQYWERRKDWYSDEFQEFVAQLIADAPDADPAAFSFDGCDAT